MHLLMSGNYNTDLLLSVWVILDRYGCQVMESPAELLKCCFILKRWETWKTLMLVVELFIVKSYLVNWSSGTFHCKEFPSELE